MFQKLEELLSCSICKEMMNNCYSLDCLHSFCSLCIRKHFQFAQTCPLCLSKSSFKQNSLMNNIIHEFIILKNNIKNTQNGIEEDNNTRENTTESTTLSKNNDRKPSVAYHLLKDKDLRLLLKNDGLPCAGDRKTLIKIHSQYVLIYNANCDALHPKSTRILLKDNISTLQKNISTATTRYL